MRVRIWPSRACGRMEAPPSKSMAHRMLICAGLAEGESIISNVDLSRDIQATLDCLRALGAEAVYEKEKRRVTIRGIDIRSGGEPAELDCGECGSTLRFMIPLCLMGGQKNLLTGSKTLFERPLAVYEKICQEQKLTYKKQDNRLLVAGRLAAGDYLVPGNISSQFISGLLFCLPLLDQDSTIRLIPPVESRPYIDMTIQALASFGVTVSWESPGAGAAEAAAAEAGTAKACVCPDGAGAAEAAAAEAGSTRPEGPGGPGAVPDGPETECHGACAIRIPGGQKYLPRTDMRVEGDYSNAAFFEALNLLGGDVRMEGLEENSLQGDQVYRRYFKELRAGYAQADLSDCPDLGPVLMAVAAALHGARFTGTRRLKIKESNRGAAMQQELAKMKVRMEMSENEIRIQPGLECPGEALDGHNDHRIVMALAVLLTQTGGEITGAQAVAKSLPDFFERLKKLGIGVNTDELDQQE